MRSRNMFFMFLIFMLFIFAVLSVAWIEKVRPEKDNVALYVVIFGFVTTNTGLLIAKISVDSGITQQNNVLTQQNQVLGAIQEKVNGGTERAMNALREQHRVEMHDKNNALNVLQNKLALAQKDYEQCLADKAELQGKLKECERTAMKEEVKAAIKTENT